MDEITDLKAKTTYTTLRAVAPLKPKRLPDFWISFFTLASAVFGLGSLFIGFWILALGVLQLIIPSLAYLAYDLNNWLWGIGFSIAGVGLILTSFRIAKQ
jgi:hypothetical protein